MNDVRHQQSTRALKLAYSWYAGLGVALALFSPTDLRHSFPMLFELVNMISVFVPAVNKVAAYSGFPEVSRLFLSVMWLTQPLATVIFLTKASWRPVKFSTIREWVLVVFVGMPFGFLLLVYFPFAFVEPGTLELSYDQTRGGAGFHVGDANKNRLGGLGHFMDGGFFDVPGLSRRAADFGSARNQAENLGNFWGKQGQSNFPSELTLALPAFIGG